MDQSFREGGLADADRPVDRNDGHGVVGLRRDPGRELGQFLLAVGPRRRDRPHLAGNGRDVLGRLDVDRADRVEAWTLVCRLEFPVIVFVTAEARGAPAA